MGFELQENKLYDNEWTNALVRKKDFWLKYAKDRGHEINGTYSNFHCDFKITFRVPKGTIIISGHRKFVDLPRGEDKYIEGFNFEFSARTVLRFPKTRSFKRNLLGSILFMLSYNKRYQINKDLVLGCKNENDFNAVNETGILDIKSLEEIRTGRKGMSFKCEMLFETDADINKIDALIKRLKIV